MLKIIFLSLVFLAHFSFLVWSRRKGERELRATIGWLDASGCFEDWRLRNPGVYIGLSEEGRKLLRILLDAYDEFLKLHKSIDGEEHRERLRRLFYDFPPKYPRGMRTGGKGASSETLSFSLLKI